MKEKKMGVVQLTVITAINMMGSGIIMLPTNLAQVGTMSVLSWVVTALGAMLLAWGFAQAGIYTHKGGGMGGYSEYSFGKAGAFMANFTYGLSLVIANVAIAISAVGYFTELFGIKSSPIMVVLLTIAVLWLASVLNFGGAKITGQLSTFTVWGVIAPLAVVIVLGWFWFNPHLYASAWNPHHMSLVSGLGASIPITLWAFLGLESASANMDRVENPKKNVPIAVLGGTIGAGILYILATNIVQGIVPNLDLAKSTAPFGLVFAHMFNPTAGNIVMGLMVISCFGSLLGWQFTIAEVFRSSAQEGYFPKVFNKVIGNGTPLVGIVIITIVQSVLAFSSISPSLSAQFTILVDLAVVTNCIPYLLSMGSLKTMQKLDGTISARKQKMTNAVAVVAGIYTLYAISQAGSMAIVLGSIVTFFGWTLYGFMSYRFDLEKV